MNHYTAQVTRSRRYWHIHVPEVDRVTQARSVAEIEPMARDLVAVMLDVDPESFTLDVQITMPATVRQHLDRAKELREQELRVRSEAAAEVRAAALELKESGIPLRDLGKLLGVSHQRAHQLVNS